MFLYISEYIAMHASSAVLDHVLIRLPAHTQGLLHSDTILISYETKMS